MKLFISSALAAAVLATSAAADARYEAVTPDMDDTPVLNIPEQNDRYQAVAPKATPELASQDELSILEEPGLSATPSADEGLRDYMRMQDDTRDFYR